MDHKSRSGQTGRRIRPVRGKTEGVLCKSLYEIQPKQRGVHWGRAVRRKLVPTVHREIRLFQVLVELAQQSEGDGGRAGAPGRLDGSAE